MRPIHYARKKAGEIIGWYFYSVDFSGSTSEYNYVTVTVVDNLSRLDSMYFVKYFKIFFPKKPFEEIAKSITESRTLIRSEFARLVTNAAPDTPSVKMPTFRHLLFFKVDQSPDDNHLNVLKGVTAPVYKQIVNQGKLPGWQLWEMWIPSNESASYNSLGLTSNTFAKAIQDDRSDDAFKKAPPILNRMETVKTSQLMRKEIKNEVWRLLDWVN